MRRSRGWSPPSARRPDRRRCRASARNRRHKPGRGFEALRYRFEIISDYGAFRDLQRHRLLTAQWQRLGCDLGADVPEEVEEAGYGDRLSRGPRDEPRASTSGCATEGLVEEASYAVSLAYRIRYVLDLNAREAIHLIELRSGREGHPDLPRRRARDARRDRRGASGGRGRDRRGP